MQGCFGQGGPRLSKKTLLPKLLWKKKTRALQTGQFALGMVNAAATALPNLGEWAGCDLGLPRNLSNSGRPPSGWRTSWPRTR